MHSNGDGIGQSIKKAARSCRTYVLQRLNSYLELLGCISVCVGTFLIAAPVGFIISGILLILFSVALSLNGRTNAGTPASDN